MANPSDQPWSQPDLSGPTWPVMGLNWQICPGPPLLPMAPWMHTAGLEKGYPPNQRMKYVHNTWSDLIYERIPCEYCVNTTCSTNGLAQPRLTANIHDAWLPAVMTRVVTAHPECCRNGPIRSNWGHHQYCKREWWPHGKNGGPKENTTPHSLVRRICMFNNIQRWWNTTYDPKQLRFMVVPWWLFKSKHLGPKSRSRQVAGSGKIMELTRQNLHLMAVLLKLAGIGNRHHDHHDRWL